MACQDNEHHPGGCQTKFDTLRSQNCNRRDSKTLDVVFRKKRWPYVHRENIYGLSFGLSLMLSILWTILSMINQWIFQDLHRCQDVEMGQEVASLDQAGKAMFGWEDHGKIMGKPWENHGKTMGKWWFIWKITMSNGKTHRYCWECAGNCLYIQYHYLTYTTLAIPWPVPKYHYNHVFVPLQLVIAHYLYLLDIHKYIQI